MGAAKPAAPDWEAIETDYRAGILSVREIAAARGVSHTAIAKRAKKDGWERDLAAKIKAKADALVSKRAVASEVSTETKVAERRVVEANAQAIATVRLMHRADIARARSMTVDMLGELEAETGNIPGLVQLGEILRSPNEAGADRLNDIYRAVISLPERIKGAKALSETLKHLISLEREAWDIAGLPVKVETNLTPAPKGLTDIDPQEATRRYLAFVSQ